jgi:hypothetical protein
VSDWADTGSATLAPRRLAIAAVLHMPIMLFAGMVLDGWHRHRACKMTGTAGRYETFSSDEAAARRFVVSANLQRRHLTTSQIGIVAAEFAKLAHGSNQHTRGERNSALQSTIDEAAVLFNVSKDTVKAGRVVLNQGTPDVIAKVRSGELAVSKAAPDVPIGSGPSIGLDPYNYLRPQPATVLCVGQIAIPGGGNEAGMRAGCP